MFMFPLKNIAKKGLKIGSFVYLQNAFSDKVKQLPFDPAVATSTTYDVASYQTTYFIAESFTDAKEKIRYSTTSLENKPVLCLNTSTFVALSDKGFPSKMKYVLTSAFI